MKSDVVQESRRMGDLSIVLTEPSLTGEHP
jgi:hypothetical protein